MRQNAFIIMLVLALTGQCNAEIPTISKDDDLEFQVCGSQDSDGGNDYDYTTCTSIAFMNERQYRTVHTSNNDALKEIIRQYNAQATQCDYVDVVCRGEKVQAVNSLLSAVANCEGEHYHLTKPINYRQLLGFEAHRQVVINFIVYAQGSFAIVDPPLSNLAAHAKLLGITGLHLKNDILNLKKDLKYDASRTRYLANYFESKTIEENTALLTQELYKDPSLFSDLGCFIKKEVVLSDSTSSSSGDLSIKPVRN